MADNSKYNSFFTKGVVTMTFPALFVPRKFKRNGKETGDPKFSANFLFDPSSEDLARFKALCAQVARAARPNVDFSTIRFPISSGDKAADKRQAKSGKDDGAFQRGKVIVQAKSGKDYPPKLAVFPAKDIKKGALDLDSDELVAKYKPWFYNGVSVAVGLNLAWYDEINDGKAGVGAYLNLVISQGTGDRLGGASSATQHFGAYSGHASQESPTAGFNAEELDDEIPF